MTIDATNQMKADAALTRDINKTTTNQELLDLLHASLERSGVAARNPETGQFIRRDPLTPAAQTVQADEPKQITRVEKIGERDITFTGTELEVANKIADAWRIAAALEPAPEPHVPVVRQKTQAEIEREISDKAELDLQFRRGQLTTQEYLERSNAIGNYLAEKGFDVEAAAQAQMNSSWAQATEEFLATTPDWPGNDRNREILGSILIAHGWDNATDKVAALRAAFKEMTEKHIVFEADVTPEQVLKLTDGMSPTEILESWKQGQNGDPEAANKSFIEIHRHADGTGSGLFDK